MIYCIFINHISLSPAIFITNRVGPNWTFITVNVAKPRDELLAMNDSERLKLVRESLVVVPPEQSTPILPTTDIVRELMKVFRFYNSIILFSVLVLLEHIGLQKITRNAPTYYNY